jgi:hypothetical protein
MKINIGVFNACVSSRMDNDKDRVSGGSGDNNNNNDDDDDEHDDYADHTNNVICKVPIMMIYFNQ